MFVRNAWYVAGWAGDIGESPTAITILNDPVVLFRAASGEVGALYDVCPHRAVPLSLGTVKDGHIVCPYHGIELDVQGVCRRNPHVKGPPDRIRTRAYPVVERDGIVWIWPGDPALADEAAVPDFSIFTSAGFATARGYTHIEADYRLIIDNLMDLAHADYIHANTVGQPGAAEVQQAKVVRDGAKIAVNTIWPDLPPSAFHRQIWTKTPHVDKYLDMIWEKASCLFLDLGVMAPGDPRDAGIRTPGAHLLTPETERSTHYFWASARDFDTANEELTARIASLFNQAFSTEDKPMIEAAQRNMEKTGAKLINFTTGDSGSALVRREIDRLVALESA
jgi:vanillate O-demethylase monooxygenase subunit